ncbi:MAG: DUF4004 family protein [Bacilli bacterium]|jgi:hypothetical protein|nr:DUF4004 family protein [Bacilli bacterium]MDY0064050.1 DUF4004 family protein [Bacilli bacterium]
MISKKDLLKEMNISYGQLYRWKREGLIPDDWFIKQSVATGQETFFKKELILPRIQSILELKDKYQLEELRNFLNPILSERNFTIKEVLALNEIDPFIAKKYSMKKEIFTIYDIILLYIFSINQDKLNFDEYLDYDFSVLKDLNRIAYILQINEYYLLITDLNTIIDQKINVYKKYRFEDVSSMIAKEI